ncbi:MAG: hypothetical protein ISS17_03410 [Bacteroidales bacterium]|nr:hypothetical protein [Bacteroidales bacterium]
MTVGDRLNRDYFEDLQSTLSAPQTNSFSVRILYYLDYLYLKKIFSRKHKRDGLS